MKQLAFILLFLSCSVRAQDFTISFELKSDDVEIHKLRFYVSNIILNDSIRPEQQQAYLINLLNDESKTISLITEESDITKVAFNLGTDSVLNTAGILQGDLDPIKGMYWAWNTGYINFKLEGKDASKQPYEYHIGGYRTPYATVRSFESQVSSEQIKLELDLNAFLEEARSISQSLMIPGKEASRLSDIFKSSLHVKK